MTRVIEFLISLLIVAALFVVIGLFLPAKRSFTYSIETNRPMATVYDLYNGFSRFKDWNPLVRYDPRMHTEVSGPEFGVGAKFAYSSQDKVVGSGSWEIVESTPGEIVRYKLVNDSRGNDKSMIVTFERTGQNNKNVKITQEYKVNYGWDLLGRYAGLYVSRNVGDDVKRGLDKFSSLLATIPKFDYTQHPNPFSIVETHAQDILLVSTASKRSNDAIAIAMDNQVSWLNKVMAANGLVADGPLRIVTNEFTGDTYGFDVVMPVRRSSTPAGTPAGDRLSLSLEGPVTYDQVPARKLATTDFTGPAPGLPRVRDMVRAWAMTHGHDTTDRPYEEYLGGVSTMLNDDAKFKVYWPVK
jgi:hypothetical protein